MKTVTSEQIGSALRGLAEDLVVARRRIATLERENRELRAKLETLERAVPAAATGHFRPSPEIATAVAQAGTQLNARSSGAASSSGSISWPPRATEG
jgi:cell division septum initiation protein DivIVA